MGFRMHKSIKLAPGVRMSFSKSGIGYSAGVKGYRVSKRADGRVVRTASLPGTGISHQKSIGGRSSSRAGQRVGAAAPPPAPTPVKPGLLAPKGEKLLYKALQKQDVASMEVVAEEHPSHALAASTVAGALMLSTGQQRRAQELFEWVFATGRDPADDPFITKYVTSYLSLEVAPGAVAELTLDRSAVGLVLAEMYQEKGDANRAADIVEQLEPTTFAALSLSELYAELGRFDDVVAMTNGIRNDDDATALLCVFRGVALRESGYLDAARESFKEALKSKKRAPVIRHRALIERARCYEAEGKTALARKDLERILAEDATYDGLAESLAALE